MYQKCGHHCGPADQYDPGCDQIIVLDEGKIVGKGTHKELLENCPVYQQIARSQMSEGGIGMIEEKGAMDVQNNTDSLGEGMTADRAQNIKVH